MDKLVVSDIYAYMRNTAGIGSRKENKITGLKRGCGDLCSFGPLLSSGSGQCYSLGFEHILNESGTVKSAGGCATPQIGDADVLLCGADILARSVAATELPVSIFTSILGAPFLIFLILRGRRQL